MRTYSPLPEVRHKAEFPQLFLIKKAFYFPVFCLLAVGVSSLEALFILCITGTQLKNWYTARIENDWLKRRLLALLSSVYLNLDLNLEWEMEKTETVEDRSYSKLTRITNHTMVPDSTSFQRKLCGSRATHRFHWVIRSTQNIFSWWELRTDGNYLLLPTGLPLWPCSASRYNGKGNVLYFIVST